MKAFNVGSSFKTEVFKSFRMIIYTEAYNFISVLFTVIKFQGHHSRRKINIYISSFFFIVVLSDLVTADLNA